MRVPFVVAIDWFLSTLDFSSVYALCKSLPGILYVMKHEWSIYMLIINLLIILFSAHFHLIFSHLALVLLIPLLFSATHDTLLFIYGFFIGLGVAIIIVFSTVGEYIPSVQEVILSMEGEELIIDAILLYQGLVFMFGINNWLGNLQRLSLLTMFVPITGILCKINYGFVLGYWYFIASEAFGVHKKLRQFLHEATFLVNNIGCVNTMIYYYRNRRITLVLRLFWLSSIIMNFLLENNAKLNVYWFLICAATASNTKLRLFALALWLPEVSYNILWTARAFLIWSVSHTADDLEPRDMGKALVFYFIATFNSVLDVDIIRRVFFITLLMFISFSYILKSVYKLCDETLKALSTSLQNNCLAHVRAIVLTLLLIWVLLYTSWIFCSMFSFRVWELVIVSTDIVTAVQALTSLAIYALFLYDLKSSKKLENLDDWVYYLNAVSNSLEFISAFLVLSFGVWDCLQGSWSVFGEFCSHTSRF